MSPQHAHDEVIKAVRLCWNNEHDKAKTIIETKKDSHPRYAVEWAFVFMVRDMLHANSKSKEEVMEMFQAADKLAQSQRSGKGRVILEGDPMHEHAKNSLWGDFTSIFAHKNKKTPAELEAMRWKLECDVIYADCLLIRSITQLRGNQYVKGAINIRLAWGHYQSLIKVLAHKGGEVPTYISDNIKFGVGMFYIFLTLVPSGLMKVLSVIGFVRDSELGEQYLQEVFRNGGVRAPISALVLLTYYLFLPVGLGDVSVTLQKAKLLLDKCNEIYPNNSYFHGYSNFYHRKKGETGEALRSIDAAISNAARPPMLLRYLRADTLFMAMKWREAVEAYGILWEEISKGKLEFEYSGQLVMTLAASHMMLGNKGKAGELMRLVPSATNQKSKQDANSPKFAKKCVQEPRLLALSGFYCLYINRDMAHMKHEDLVSLEAQLDTFNREYAVQEVPETTAMSLLFRGVMQKGSGRVDDARKTWSALIKLKQLHKDSPSLPYGHYELGELEYRQGNLKAAKKLLDHGATLNVESDTLANRYNRAISLLDKEIRRRK
eukprot:TRINITY_DN24365_c0_g1_i1.p1 TRINITY_DN24365_c0_g1~~TRINITY_DN24365_c0_g1_i1.p1  ORF type:complete len:548 (+),score=145.37 TRINITY_DN24365_c0_g1_i1:76-1719(+)